MSTSENRGLEQLYEFGPFRVDPARETLLKEGVGVPLTPKTFQILLVLVRHGQEIVTKDDLMKTVWPDTFVEEANLSRNIFMLRKALGETAQDHRYIVTVPGRGYRLAENVNLVPGQDFAIATATHSTMHIDVKETSPWKWIALAAVILFAIAAGLWRLLSIAGPFSAPKTRLCWPILPTLPATPSSMKHCVRGWRFSSGNRLSSASSPTSAFPIPCA